MKPDINAVLEVVAMKDRISDLYDAIDDIVSGFMKEFGEGRYDYDLSNIDEVDSGLSYFVNELKKTGNYLKFEITDNIKKLNGGETIYKTTSFKPVSFSSGSLKNRPKSLNG